MKITLSKFHVSLALLQIYIHQEHEIHTEFMISKTKGQEITVFQRIFFFIGDHLLLAVKKMKGDIANMIQFKSIQLMAVEPPSSKASYYSLPSEFTETEINAKYSLFDSSGRVSININISVSVTSRWQKCILYLNQLCHSCTVLESVSFITFCRSNIQDLYQHLYSASIWFT